MTGHTPNWKWTTSEPPGQFIIHDYGTTLPNSRQIPTIAYCKTAEHARLIAAAPTMEAALLAIIDMIDGCPDAPFDPSSLPQAIKQTATVALTKATKEG